MTPFKFDSNYDQESSEERNATEIISQKLNYKSTKTTKDYMDNYNTNLEVSPTTEKDIFSLSRDSFSNKQQKMQESTFESKSNTQELKLFEQLECDVIQKTTLKKDSSIYSIYSKQNKQTKQITPVNDDDSNDDQEDTKYQLDANLNKFEQLEEQRVKGTSDFMQLLDRELNSINNNNNQSEFIQGNQNNQEFSSRKAFLKKGSKSNSIKNR